MDQTLLRAARSGDRIALTQLCEALYPALYGFFVRQGGPQSADDLTQETLMRVLDNLPRYRPLPGARFEGWVFRIAYRLFVDEKRKRPSLPLPDWECADPRGDPAEEAARRARAERVRRAMAALPDELRAMVTMRYELEMSHQGIAQALGVPGPRVKSRLHDALKRLRRILEEEEDHDG